METRDLNIKERLKDIAVGHHLKPAVTKDIATGIQRKKKLRDFIAKEIDRILKEIYEPLNLYGVNPNSPDSPRLGVLDENGNWAYQNYFDTNYSCHEILFNRCNIYIFNLYKKKGIESIEISGETFSYLTPIVIDENTLKNDSLTLRKLKKLLILIDNFKEQIFSPGSEILELLINTCKTSSFYGDQGQKFYVDHIHDFFDDIIDTRVFGGHGNAEDRKTGIDAWTNHKDGSSLSHQIKGTCNFIQSEGGFLVKAALSPDSRCDLYVFSCVVNKRILILRNIKKELVWGDQGVFFPMKLKYDEKFYNQ